MDLQPTRTADASTSCPSLDVNRAKARFGVAYLRAVCSQAGVPMTETSPDEDVMAVDCDIKFPEVNGRVQVKCTSQFKIRGRAATWPVKRHWLQHWQQSKVPVYFVLVIVEADQAQWVAPQPGGTFQHAAAFWTRVDHLTDVNGILIPKQQRLTAATFRLWHQECLAAFGQRPEVPAS